MEIEEIKEYIDQEVKKQMNKEKTKLCEMVKYKFQYSGELAKARYLIDLFEDWAK